MPWVESIVPEVWTSKGALKVNERVELDADEAEYLKGREQVILVEPEGAPKKRGRPKGSKNKPKAEGDDAEPEAEEQED